MADAAVLAEAPSIDDDEFAAISQVYVVPNGTTPLVPVSYTHLTLPTRLMV